MKKSPTLLGVMTFLLMTPMAAFAQLPSPSYGLNLGNTMEATCGVGCWSPAPTQALINSFSKAGFNTLRIPCAWVYNSSNGTINSTYMSQVTQLVNWALADNMYVIINEHWDNGWFEDNGFNSYNSTLNSQLQNVWTQVANNFKNTSTHLLFACANEPNASTAAQTTVLFQYYQNWVNTVRATGGNNASRWLVVQGPSANIDDTAADVTAMPTDSAKHVMLEVHDYDPYQFSLMTSDQSWGAMFYFWGAAYHTSKSLTNRNATWGEESYFDSEFSKMQTDFVKKGTPVFIGEWRASPKPSESDLTGKYITQNYNSCTYWNYFVHNAINSYGMTGCCWDTSSDLFNWTTGAVIDQTKINAVLGKSYVAPISGL